MLNPYVWELYIKSGGDKVVAFFANNLSKEMSSEYAEGIFQLQKHYCVSKAVLESTKEELTRYSLIISDLGPDDFEEVNDYLSDNIDEAQVQEDIDEIFNVYYQRLLEEFGTDKNVFEVFTGEIEGCTTDYSLFNPGIFVPYYFFSNYNVLSMIADTFGVQLSELPKKSDYKARTWHYANLCKAFYRFRKDNHLSYYEFCAFLYDFAPRYIGGIGSYIIEDIPAPKAAFFIGGGGDNADAEAENNPDEITHWQCSPDTRAGDMIVMYLRTPISAISSIWRSQSVGFIDPFFYYYRCTFIGSPHKVPRIPIKEIKTDPILGKMPIVAKNMQGINGVELRPSEYNYIVDRSEIDAPKLEYAVPGSNMDYENEKEVEEKLIKPLLKRLGYLEQDYVQQMYIEIGNHNHALIPDFVLEPVTSGGHYSGFTIIEAKRSIKIDKQLNETKTQARSYAKLLGTRYAVIASMEKVWVTSAKDDYTQSIFEESWDALSDADVFYGLEKLIGRRHII